MATSKIFANSAVDVGACAWPTPTHNMTDEGGTADVLTHVIHNIDREPQAHPGLGRCPTRSRRRGKLKAGLADSRGTPST